MGLEMIVRTWTDWVWIEDRDYCYRARLLGDVVANELYVMFGKRD